jgi:ubiquitin C-terminal hydrolase
MALISSDSDLEFSPFGSINSGGTCYFNALMQAIFSCTVFQKTLLQIHHCDINENNIVLMQLINIGRLITIKEKLIETKREKMYAEKLNKINDSLIKAFSLLWLRISEYTKINNLPSLQPGQQCAMEGFNVLMETLDSIADIKMLFANRRKHSIFCKSCCKWVSSKTEMSNMFLTTSDLKTEQLAKFSDMDVNYNKTQSLQSFLQIENTFVDADYKCPDCKKKGEKFKSTTLLMVPEILVVFSMKYNVDNKINSITPFPKTMEFKSKNKTTLSYEAVAQIDHGGDRRSGHYWAICKRKDGWYRLDDMNISKSNFTPTKNTYAVVYNYVK